MLLNAPGYLFALPGVALGLAGVFVMAASLLTLRTGPVTFRIHTMIAGSLLVILGYQVGVLGLFTAVVSDPIRGANDPVSRYLAREFSLERGLAVGFLLFAAGAAVAGYLLTQWLAGAVPVPSPTVALTAFTLLVLGAQTAYYAFFLSAVGWQPDGADSRDTEVVDGR